MTGAVEPRADARAGAGSAAVRHWRTAAVVVAILLLAATVRLVGLTDRAIWLDETVSLDVAAHPMADIARGAAFDNHTPPLYYLLLHAWFRVVAPSALTLRLPSVAADIVCLLTLMIAVSRAFGGRAGMWVGVAYAVAPFAIRLAQEGRMYSLLAALVVGCFASAARVDRRPRDVWPYVAVSLLAAAAMYTHYYSILSVAVLHAVMAWRLRADRGARRRWWLAMVGSAAAFAPWLPIVAQVAASGGQGFRAFRLAVLPYAGLRFAVGFSIFPMNVHDKLDLRAAVLDTMPLLVVIGAVSTAVVMLGLNAVVPGRSGEGRGVVGSGGAGAVGWLVAALAIVPPVLALGVTMVVPSLDARYLTISFPFLLVVAVLGVIGPHARRWVPVRWLAVAMLVVGAVAQVADPDAGTTPWREMMMELERRSPAGGQVLVRPGFYDRVLELQLDARRWRIVDDVDDLRPGSSAWLVEVVFLTRGRPFGDPRWMMREDLLLPSGNGLRLTGLAVNAAGPVGAG